MVDNLLDSYSSAAYTLSDLQQRPLPPELDATCLETYLDDKTFQVSYTTMKYLFVYIY
ncbi:unnamed protein product [Trichobilharzia regenti]|nr:unnamed protein product [Trichobilharzia regenti]